LGQIIFLYFLQKKGWFGVLLGKNWGDGDKKFLRNLFGRAEKEEKNYFNDYLEPLFYEALRNDRSHEDHYFSMFNCKIPFLNGGLFDPINGYDWKETDIKLPNELFSNNVKTKEGDKGTGILDVFDRYNFTVKEDEPLEKEVAIDPELLGKSYEKFNAIRPDNYAEFKKALKSGKKGEENKFNKKFGVYYTPREIVHYMCQQSLINYLDTSVNTHKEPISTKPAVQEKIFGPQSPVQQTLTSDLYKPVIPKKDIETLIHAGEQFSENEARVLSKGRETKTYSHQLPESIRRNAKLLDDKLAEITVCDPAVGSGAFPVGMMSEIVKARNVLSVFIDDKNRKIYNFKRQCIEHSLYGVDIDPGAVEIAKLRLWLSLVVDEDDIKNIKPLPNLDYKVVCGNSLLGYPYRPRGLDKIEILKERFLNETRPKDKIKLHEEIDEAIYGLYENTKKSLGYQVLMDFNINFSEVFHRKGGFDIVIANPPYVSTKGRDETDKKSLKTVYGFGDDLYSHFYFKAIEIATDNKGVVLFISSKTFWTIQTKRNLRELFLKNRIIEIYDTANPFEAMVDTCVIIIQKDKNNNENYPIQIKDGKKELLNPREYEINVKIYRNAVNNVFFMPHKFNLKIYDKYNHIVKALMDKWWDKISTSKNIEKNKGELEKYRQTLKPDEVTLLGLITEGGQGLATANNGKYIGVLESAKYAENIKISRPKKLLQAITSSNIKELKHIKNQEDAVDYLENQSEFEIRELFDGLKEKYGRDIFGQGYLFRIVSKNGIADVNSLSQSEKSNGIRCPKTFVPYDKGDKEGNRWYLKTPYYIEWSEENVKRLRNDQKARWQGYNFYFKEGFCWTNVLNPNARLIKCRLKDKTVNDVGSMALYSLEEFISTKYLVCILNSNFIFDYYRNFINQSVNIQLNDIRQLPIIIPSEIQLTEFENVFYKAYEIKQKQFDEKILREDAERQLEQIQNMVDNMVYKLYDLTPEEIKIVEGKHEDAD
ncbi:Eco57I restriction-modification methylase domain-containing protein, partial [Patescibacteria group bacterium]|nr:Eco57I restriction-modification methylase domain-containing protein [Patescibacteria group bacterium]